MSNKQRFSKALSAMLGRVEESLKQNAPQFQEKFYSAMTLQSDASNFDEDELKGQQNAIAEELVTMANEVDAELIEKDELEPLTVQSAAIKAGLMISALYGNVNAAGKYAKAGLANRLSGDNVITLQSIQYGPGGEIEVARAGDYTQQSFDNNELGKYIPRSVLFNVLASRQDRFGEAWFPTHVMAPSESGLAITVERQEVISFATRDANGKPISIPRKSLVKAFKDHKILSRPSTELVPFVSAENDEFMVAESLVGNRNFPVGESNIVTRPLKIGTEVNMLGVSNSPVLLQGGVLNTTDEMAVGGGVKALYVSFSNGTDTEVFSFNTEMASRNQFNPAPQGKDRDIQLMMPAVTLILDKNTQLHSDVDSTLLARIKADDLVVKMTVAVTGYGSLQTSNVVVNAAKINVVEVVNAAKESLPLADGVGKEIADLINGLAPQAIAWDPMFRRSNTNWRTLGDLVDVSSYSMLVDVQPGYPLAVISSTEEEQHGMKLAGIINANRARTSNSAVTTLINYVDHLGAQTEALRRGVDVDIAGQGKWLITPYHAEVNCDVVDRVRTRRSGELVQDICWVLVDAIRDAAYQMYTESQYGTVLEMVTGSPDMKPTIVIGCDPITERYLNIAGDTRLLGDKFDVQIVSTYDDRMYDNAADERTLYMSFTRKQPGHLDCAGFGTFAIIPEMMQKITMDRDGTTYTQDRVIPRQMHVPVLPCAVKMTIKNLSAAVNGQI